ncbi:MAG: UDP-GlcNAc:undecaprenyl-phosphate/decaprenyl-phosphate GlcNAc-phosphate transferase [Bacillota bacterium]|nr:UDP-GlcNAc:undecaprenyl-phosphate/decaprenyl-phosphate GlcNAc-phosphate transferase [Bacillota bacterium]
MPAVIGSFVVAALVAYLATPAVRRLAVGTGALDKPDSGPGARHIHTRPTPRLGGLAIFAGFTAAAGVGVFWAHLVAWPQLVSLWLGAFLVAAVGVVDDYVNLPAKVKLAGQVLAACVFVFFGNSVEWVTNPWAAGPFPGMTYIGGWGILLTILWLVGVTNTLNLIDGLDGLAAGVASIASVTLLLVALQEGQPYVVVVTAALAGAALGFLPYNFHPAQIFMGDTGSMFLGFTLAGIAVQGTLKSATTIALAVPLLALGLPILDTTLAIVRRFVHGRPIFQADRGHLHHRLLALGLSQRQAVLILYFVSGCFGLSAVALADVSSQLVAATLLLVGLGLTLAIGRAGAPATRHSGKHLHG